MPPPPPPAAPCESNTEVPTIDGNNTYHCSDKGVALVGGGGGSPWVCTRFAGTALWYAPLHLSCNTWKEPALLPLW